jgi:hypothetical protein
MMQHKRFYMLFVMFCWVCSGYAQQRMSVNMQRHPLGDLLQTIESQANYRIFCIPSGLDSIEVSVNAVDQDPPELLRQALQQTNCHIYVFRDCIFITRDKEIITALPKNFLGESENIAEVKETPVTIPDTPIVDEQPVTQSVSEQKTYEIGKSSLPAKEKVSLSGYVTDIRTGEPIPGVSVFIENPVVGTATDVFGYYSIRLPRGRQELNVHAVGMKDTRRQIILHSDGKLNIELQEKVYSINEIVVRADKIDNISATSLGMERLQMKEIKNIPTIFGEADILRIVLSLPGVKSVGEISSGFNVRGGATDQNLILYNDGTVYNPTHMFGLFSAFNPDVVKDMELYKSSIPARYGGRISSVLDVNNREGNRKKIQGSASIGLLTGRLSIEGPLFSGKTSFLLGGRTTYSDWLLNKIPETNDYHNGHAGFYDLNAAVAHKFDEHNSISFNGYFSRDRFAFTDEESYAYRNANASGKWRHIFNPKFTGVLTAGYDHYDYAIKNSADTITAYTLDFGIDQLFAKADFSWYASNQHTVSFGLGSIHYNYIPGNYLPNHRGSLVAVDRQQHEKALESAIYMGDEWAITPKLAINAGIRYSVFNVLGPRTYNIYLPEDLPSVETITATDSSGGILKTFHGPEFRFSARYSFSDRMSVKAGVNTMRQYIHKISNSTVMSPTDIWKLSDTNIRPQYGMQIAAGLFGNFSNNMFETSLELYYKTMNHYLDYRPGAELVMNHHIETEMVETEGRSYGAELMIKKVKGKLNGWVSYTCSRTMLRQVDPRIALPVNDGGWYPADFDKPHEIKLAGNFKLTHRYSISLNCDYSTGRPITIPVAKYRYVGGQYVYYTERNMLRVPDFFRIDLAFNIEPGHHLTQLTHSWFSFGVYNLTGRNNAYSVYYVLDRGQIQGYKLAIFGVPVPYVSYNIKF